MKLLMLVIMIAMAGPPALAAIMLRNVINSFVRGTERASC